MLVFILAILFCASIELIDGIKTMLMLPITAIGTNSIGKTMPIITPKLEIASPEESPESISIDGIIRDVIG